MEGRSTIEIELADASGDLYTIADGKGAAIYTALCPIRVQPDVADASVTVTPRCTRRCVIVRATTGTARLIADNSIPLVQLEMAAVQQHLLEQLARSLHARFCARDGKTKPVCQLLLRQPFVLGQIQRLAVDLGKRSDHGLHRRRQPGHSITRILRDEGR